MNRDRRTYFRIDEHVALSFEPVSAQTAAERSADEFFPGSAVLRLHAELKRVDAEAAQLILPVKEQSRALGDYLHLLDRKIELLTQHLMADQQKVPLKPRPVNLSDNGIAFGNPEPLESGQHLALHITFLPSHAGVVLFAEVVRCEPDPINGWQIAAEFQHITSQQQQLISQQIMRAQLAEKRRQHDEDGLH
ncbi:PilZ domain-containing protein [Marinimicrobium alkaliphilum]|uniref:PilZ domain-containing protein n=1 Tax=Marinimicrobium alkaliphilum TaxID=2202654 RepID=UPI000DBA831B|nr:PilZ domain-containing protein [Marinimicrobium alkaliphilum]